MTTGVMARRDGTARVATRGHGFYLGMAIAILGLVLAAFWQRYYLRIPSGTLTLPWLVHLHAAVFSSWILLLVAQTGLVTAGRVDLHRRLGLLGGILAVAIIVLGVAVAVLGGRTGWLPGGARGPFRSSLEFMIVPMWDIAIFGGFVAAALIHRRRPETHKRLMILATVGGLLWAAITRVPPIVGKLPLMLGVLALFLLAGPVRDLLARRRPHPVDIWGGLIVLASLPLRTALARTEAWHAVAAWLVR